LTHRHPTQVLNVLVLILVLCLSGLSQAQNKIAVTADDLLIKFIEYFDNNQTEAATKYLLKAVELDPTKSFYINIIGYMANGKLNEALKLLEERKNQSPAEKELKAIQILAANTHLMFAVESERQYDYINAIWHYEAAYGIDIILRRKNRQ
jgi:tetratricopeptide (TPR) repeat protein